MSTPFEIVRKEYVTPDGFSPRTLHLSPLDVHSFMDTLQIRWPFFFDYDIDASRLVEALRTMCVKYPFLCGRVRPHEDTRYIIEASSDFIHACSKTRSLGGDTQHRHLWHPFL